MEKEEKQRQRSATVLLRAPQQQPARPPPRGCPDPGAALTPDLHGPRRCAGRSGIQPPQELLGFTCIYFGHLLATRGLRYQKSLTQATFCAWECGKTLPCELMTTGSSLYAALAYERFHRLLCLQTAGTSNAVPIR